MTNKPTATPKRYSNLYSHQISPSGLEEVEDRRRDEDEEGGEDEAQEGQVQQPDVESGYPVGDPGV